MKYDKPASSLQKGMIVLSIDDGNADDFRAYENILAKYEIPATFNIVTGTIDTPEHLTMEQLCRIYQDPRMEIAAHGHTHQNDDEDIVKSVQALREWLDMPEGAIGFASPGSQMSTQFIRENGEHLKELGLLYARTAGNIELNARHRELQEELRQQGAPEYLIENVAQLTYAFDCLCVHSVVVLHDTPLAELEQLVELAAAEQACIVFMFHRIKKAGEANAENTWSYDYEQFAEFMAYLARRQNEGAIDIGTNRQAWELMAQCQ